MTRTKITQKDKQAQVKYKNMPTARLLNLIFSDERVSDIEYYAQVDSLVGRELEYYGMRCKVNCVFKYVHPEHFYDGFVLSEDQSEVFLKTAKEHDLDTALWQPGVRHYAGYKALYIIENLDAHEDDEHKYMYADCLSLEHSEEMRVEEEKKK